MKRSASPAFGSLVIKLTSNIKSIGIRFNDTFKIWVDLPCFSKLILRIVRKTYLLDPLETEFGIVNRSQSFRRKQMLQFIHGDFVQIVVFTVWQTENLWQFILGGWCFLIHNNKRIVSIVGWLPDVRQKARHYRTKFCYSRVCDRPIQR